jgi:hypothetical protein
VTLQATVTGSGDTPTGTVKFVYDGITLASSKLSAGVATYSASTTGLPPGSYAVTAEYSGDSNYAASNSLPVTVQLTKAATTTTIAASPTTITPPASVTLTATVAKTQGTGMPTGTVTFSYSTLVLGTATLNNSGVATLSASSKGVPPGSYGVVAKYNGNANNAASTSTPVTVIVK